MEFIRVGIYLPAVREWARGGGSKKEGEWTKREPEGEKERKWRTKKEKPNDRKGCRVAIKMTDCGPVLKVITHSL